MSKIKKTDLLNLIQEQADMFVELTKMVELNKQAINKLKNEHWKIQFKQIDHSIFEDVDEFWRFAATDKNGDTWLYREPPYIDHDDNRWVQSNHTPIKVDGIYDASNWQKSLICRDDIAKELLEVDLSSELTGSELCKAMLARGDKYVMCFVNDKDEEAAKNYKRVRVIHSHGIDYFDDTTEDMWDFAVPINSQGEPLTAIDVGI